MSLLKKVRAHIFTHRANEEDDVDAIPDDCKGLYFFKGYDNSADEEIGKHTHRREKLKQEELDDKRQ